jgi:hypothetical protein
MRHGLQEEAACALCDEADENETTDHLLAACVYSRKVWFRLLHSAGLQQLVPDSAARLADWWFQVRLQVPRQLRRGFDSMLLLITWGLWKERNRRTFQGERLLPAQLVQRVIDEANAWTGPASGLCRRS